MEITLSKSMPITDDVPGLGTVSIVWEGVDAVKLCIEETPPDGYFKEVLAALPEGD